MLGIQKAPETMTAKQRVLNTFAFEKTDRVPMDYMANPTVHHTLCSALGIANDNMLTLYEALGVDYRTAWPAYTGPLLFPEIPGRIVNPEYGFMRAG